MIAFNDETHLDTTPPDCHGKEARNDQLVGVRAGRVGSASTGRAIGRGPPVIA